MDLDTFSAEPKNPNIRRFFSELNWADEIGSGVKNITKHLNIYTPVAKPSFIEDDMFKTAIPLIIDRIGDRYAMLIGLAQLNSNQVGERKLNLSKNIPLNSEFKELTDADLLAVELAKTWEEKSRELDKLRFLIINNIQIERVKKAGSWEEKSRELLKKRGKTILRILILTLEPASLEELTKTLGYKDKDRFRDDYIKTSQS